MTGYYRGRLGIKGAIFEAAVYAIPRAETWVIDEWLKGKHIAPCSDNQAALGVWSSHLIILKFTQECRNRTGILQSLFPRKAGRLA